mmetsp:Transcript_25400/g.45858  ORF Transcript_25400/g.45858 Transcript_25400/m.45858 type:complete len:940 (+) Transcript_25400:94-2913(+)
MSCKHPLKPKSVIQLHLGANPSSSIREVAVELPSIIQVMHNNSPSCDSSYSSQEDSDPILNIMNVSSPTLNYLPRDFMPRGMLLREEKVERRTGVEDWTALQKELSASVQSPSPSHEPFVDSFPAAPIDYLSPKETTEQQLPPKSILRSRSSLSSQNNRQHQKRQQSEIQSILATLEELQHNFVTNDNSTSSSYNPQIAVQKEFMIRHFPNGDLFSGNVDADTKELIYGRMTCALEMEVYEGPFWKGKRHGEGADCAKMDGSAKFLGRYHEGQMHSGTLIVTRGLPSDFTYTGSFLNNDFHGIGTIVSKNGSIYQGQFAYGQYHGIGTLRTVCEEEEEEEEDDERKRGGGEGNNKCNGVPKMESVYTGDFSEGLFHGSGSLTHSDGSSYVGTWSEGKRVEGTETLRNGDVFEGKYLNDVREGQGVLRMKCGKITKSGVWEGDVLKEGVDLNITFGDGHVYCGDHAHSVPHGFGRMEYADLGSGESAYTGWFVNGFRHGEGRCFFHKTGEEYEGEWACDEPIGLDLFQHNGPLIEGRGDGEDILETIECPPTSLNQLHNALSKNVPSKNNNTHRKPNTELNSSLVSAASSGLCSADTLESIALSSITAPQREMRRSSERVSTTESDNLSLSMKSLSVFDYSEQDFKIYRYQNGDIFKGRLDKITNLRQGSGVYTEHRMGSVYNGDWRDSKRHGVGHLELASGVEYSGEFFEDKIHGQGSLTLIDGSVYSGSFFNGLFHGRGMLEDEGRNGVYFGEFENGERSGEGDEKLSDASRYKGEYKLGKRNGMGVLFDPDGSELYRGEWHEDLRHGKGKLARHQQEGLPWEGSYDGDFFQDKFSGNGKYTYTDGTSIEGQWLDDVPRDGDWSIKYPNRSKFYGFATFQHPEEKSVASDLSSLSRGLSGEFLRVPLPHGFGSLTYPSGQRFVGSFVYGEYNDGNRKK